MKQFDAVGIGRCTADHIAVTPHYPAEDKKLRISEFTQQGGGLTATTMVGLSRLGVSSTFIAKLGEDSISRFILDGFDAEKVDTSFVLTDPSLNGPFSFIIVNRQTGSRTILHTWDETRRLSPKELPRKTISSARLVLVDDYEAPAAIEAARICARMRIPSVLDADGVCEDLPLLIREVDYPVLSSHLAMELTTTNTPARAARRLYEDFLPRLAVDVRLPLLGRNG